MVGPNLNGFCASVFPLANQRSAYATKGNAFVPEGSIINFPGKVFYSMKRPSCFVGQTWTTHNRSSFLQMLTFALFEDVQMCMCDWYFICMYFHSAFLLTVVIVSYINRNKTEQLHHLWSKDMILIESSRSGASLLRKILCFNSAFIYCFHDPYSIYWDLLVLQFLSNEHR